jgi:hypothetical protein
MPAPFDYTLQAQNPGAAVLTGLQGGLAIKQIRDAQQQAELQKQQQLQMQADLAEASRDHSKLPDVMIRYPALAEKLSHGYKAMNEDQQRAQLQHASEVAAALQSGRPDVAVQALKDHAKALRNSGDEEGAKRLDATAQWGEMHPDSLLTSTLATMYALGDDGKRAAEGVLAIRKAPAEEKKATAEANTAVSTSQTAAVTAEYAKPMAVADLKTKAANLGLTNAQTNQAIALTKKYNQETQQAILNLAGGGALGSPEKVFEAEQKLRKEYEGQTANYTTVSEAYRRIKQTKTDAAGDLSLIFSYMKMLDPGSTVREGEFATAQNAVGVPDRVRNMVNKVLSGERLAPEQRKQFLGQAEGLFTAASKREEEVRGGLTKVAKAYKLNADNIFSARLQEATAPAAPAAPAKIASDADYAALPSGAEYVAPDGSTRRKR